MAPVAEFDPSVPSIARVYDYFLGGKDNFAADRALAEQQITFAPLIPVLARENRQFLARTAAWAANQGIDQFIDLGCGMPTVPNTHESARAVNPIAKVAYVDNDPVVLSHLNALVAKGDPDITAVDGDVREPTTILAAIGNPGGIDLTRPACLIMGYLLHFLDPQAARELVTAYASALAPGSCVVISVIRADRGDADESFGGYSKAVARVYNHSPEDFASFFGPLELVPPGAVDARQWHPDWKGAADLKKRDGYVLAAVARRLQINNHKYPERVLTSPDRFDLRRAKGRGG
jgi:O-methyltransferase involved in polyketide biosynthesis